VSKKICAIVIFTVLLGIIFSPLFNHQEVLAQGEISDKVSKLCEKHYEQYKKSGSMYLEQNYAHLHYLKDCFKLYTDDNWDFFGKDKIDKHYEKQSLITSNNNIRIKNYDNQKLDITNRSITQIGDDEYKIKVRMCLDGRQISEPKFFVVSEKEYYLSLGNKIIHEDSCAHGYIFVKTQNPDEIKFIPFNGNYVPSKYMKVKTLYWLYAITYSSTLIPYE